MRTLLVLGLVPLLAMLGCNSSKKADSKELVQKAIETYLAQRQNLVLANMDMEVANVKFEGETATADVKFRSKQASSMAVNIHYKLKRRGDGWEVVSSAPAAGPGGSPHGTVTHSAPEATHGDAPLESSH